MAKKNLTEQELEEQITVLVTHMNGLYKQALNMEQGFIDSYYSREADMVKANIGRLKTKLRKMRREKFKKAQTNLMEFI